MKKTNLQQTIMTLSITIAILISAPQATALLQLDNIYFDPAIIAAGDEVDIVIEYHNDLSTIEEERYDDDKYTFKVELQADDTLTEDYVIIQDRSGDDLHGTIYSGEKYNKVFRVKVLQEAPAGNYEFKLTGTWYKEGVAEKITKEIRFEMPVKKEGIIIDVGTLITTPAEVRPGDDYVQLDAYIENTGQKDAKAVEIKLDAPEGISASYTNNNRIWLGQVKAGERKKATLFVDVDEYLQPQAYQLRFTMDYTDLDDNKHQRSTTMDFLVKPRPYLEVEEKVTEATAGKTAILEVQVKNTGTEEAESVDVRVLKQSAQPFTMDVRTDYIGSLKPGEEGTAIFKLDIDKEAAIKTHDVKLIIRAKGDTDAGDDNIYTYNRNVKLEVTGKARNNYAIAGVGIGGLAIIGLIIGSTRKRK